MNSLDDIAKEAAQAYLVNTSVSIDEAICSAMYKAIEFVLTREPNERMIKAAQSSGLDTYDTDIATAYRAMTAVLLEELRKPFSLGEAFVIEQDRVRVLFAQYKSIPGGGGAFGAVIIDNALRRAACAAISGDPVAIMRSYNELKEFPGANIVQGTNP